MELIIISTKAQADKCRKVLAYHLNGEPSKAIDPVEIKDGTYICTLADEAEILKIITKSDYTKREVLESELNILDLTKL